MNTNPLMGAIIGDMVGSIYESKYRNVKDKDFNFLDDRCHFTDDTVCTIAIADWLVKGGDVRDFLRKWARKYPHAGYGKGFKSWFMGEEKNYKIDSWGNGSAMRVSPTAWVSESLEETLDLAKQSAEWTHNHEEGIKGAQATAAAIWLARHGKTKAEIQEYISDKFDYDLYRSVDAIKPHYTFSSWCQTSVPESIICFLEGTSTENAIRNAVWLNGDTDTMAAISGSIALAFYDDISEDIVKEVRRRLPKEMLEVIDAFDKKISE